MQKAKDLNVIDDVRDPPLAFGRARPETGVWRYAVSAPDFQRLMRMKRLAIIPMMAIPLIFFFGVTVLFGYKRTWMGSAVGGGLNLGYLLILVTYALCWIVALLYFAIATYLLDPLAERAKAYGDGDRS